MCIQWRCLVFYIRERQIRETTESRWIKIRYQFHCPELKMQHWQGRQNGLTLHKVLLPRVRGIFLSYARYKEMFCGCQMQAIQVKIARCIAIWMGLLLYLLYLQILMQTIRHNLKIFMWIFIFLAFLCKLIYRIFPSQFLMFSVIPLYGYFLAC